MQFVEKLIDLPVACNEVVVYQEAGWRSCSPRLETVVV